VVHGDVASSTCGIASVHSVFVGNLSYLQKKEKTIYWPLPLQKKKDETLNLHLIGIAAVAAMPRGGSGVMSQGVAVFAGRHPASSCLNPAQKNETTINLCSIGSCFLIHASGNFNNIVCPIVNCALWPNLASTLPSFFDGASNITQLLP